MSEGKRENLPKWAREYIKRLERKVINLEVELDSFNGSTPDSPVAFFGLTETKPVREGTYRFNLGGPRNYLDVRIRHSHQEGEKTVLEIHGDDELRIIPHASNAIQLINKEGK